MSRPAPPINRSDPGSGKGADKLKRQQTPEARAKLSEIAKKRHQESDGKGFGRGLTERGSKPKRKPSKARIAQLVAESAREKENAEKIIEVFKDGVADTQPMSIRLKAAEAWIKVETENAKIQLNEDANESIQRDRGELLQMLSGKLMNGPAAALLRKQLAERAESEGDIIDVDPDDVEEVEEDSEE